MYLALKGKHDEKNFCYFLAVLCANITQKKLLSKNPSPWRYNPNQNYFLLWAWLSDDVDKETAVFDLFSKPMAVGLF